MKATNLAGSGTHTLEGVWHLARMIVGTSVDTATVVVRHAETDDNIVNVTLSGTDTKTVEMGIDFTARSDIEVVASGATDVTVVYA